MAWEKRHNQYYYYRKQRVNGRVVSEYVGTGIYAELADWLDEEIRADRRRIRTEQKKAQGQFMDLSRQVDEISDQLSSLTNVILQAHGYYMHKGQWRRRYERA